MHLLTGMLLSRSSATILTWLVAVVLIAQEANGQQQAPQTPTPAHCNDGFSWMLNSLNQDPCVVSTFLFLPCADTTAVTPISPDELYQPPESGSNVEFGADLCTCSSVVYSTVQACAVCQDAEEDQWLRWTSNCSSNLVTSQGYPKAIPDNTAVPAWAYQNVVQANLFNITLANQVASMQLPDSTGLPSPTASPQSTNTGTTTSSANAFIPALVGGLVGGLTILGICGIVAAYLIRNGMAAKRRAQEAARFQPVIMPDGIRQLQHQRTFSGDSSIWAPSIQWSPGAQTSYIRPYDPKDPTTYPSPHIPVV